MRHICILGASGSIGRQTIDVVKKNQNDFSIVGISIGNRTDRLSKILKSFPSIKFVCLKEEKKAKIWQHKYPNIIFYHGDKGLDELIIHCHCDMVINALVGFVGFLPSVCALKHNKILCLANKESLVVGGEIINNLLSQGKGKLYPIDSEHSAIYKCLAVDNENVEKIIITASGGAFRKLSRKELTNVTPEDALKHPTWRMGNKITIDCATMVNKSFEIIEAYYLFGYDYNCIDVLLHDESMIHSLVKYHDGNYRLDIGKPDMRIPIKYALYEGKTPFSTVYTDDYTKVGDYHFHQFKDERYPMVKYAKKVIEEKGIYGATYNAANEVAVYAFLNHQIPFLDIERIITRIMENTKNIKNPTINQLIEADKKTRLLANSIIKERS